MTLRKFAIALNAFAVLALVGLLVTAARLRKADLATETPIPQLGALPDFQLVDSKGMPFGSAQLKGKIWVADFVFTSCTGICPILSTNMSKLHRNLVDRPDVHLVSVSVDPETDTPEVLARYASRYSADTSRWHFLTGPRERIHQLAVAGFKVGSVDEPIFHSNRFILVDGDGAIRGYYVGTEPEDMAKLNHDINTLLESRSSG